MAVGICFVNSAIILEMALRTLMDIAVKAPGHLYSEDCIGEIPRPSFCGGI